MTPSPSWALMIGPGFKKRRILRFSGNMVLKIPADFILSDAISYQRPLADAAVSLSQQHNSGYLMVYPRPSRQASSAR